MPIPYEQSYLGQLRQVTGNRKLISIGARAIVQNDMGGILLVKRRDNGHWVMPAGGGEFRISGGCVVWRITNGD